MVSKAALPGRGFRPNFSDDMKMIELSNNILIIESLLTREECNQLIDQSETIGYSEADIQVHEGRQHLPKIRNNHRVNLYSEPLAQELWHQLASYTLPIYERKQAIGLSPYFRFYRYTQGQKFKIHQDGRQNVEGNETLFTLLIFLSEDFKGGETLFRQDRTTITPKTGHALIFEHRLWHKGCIVEEGIKYVLRTDIVYSP
ncbi:2OG-Fe(II) oxygenase [Roseofilum sp. BLCC_M91]|uniref:2OG-Fe(II) oxygenase n=1 Tax=Roseofilum halophilum BLCC-M91 TaxID=3022259 RepID=A0ABT7BJE8_9CYAN|nr:2OG-Fe(II) oxygenase [Roseofilum halophilum]MDJ1178418.1 2OG-Fe(II) oxygenase [Roseofilum halophilum BLCC-M91]